MIKSMTGYGRGEAELDGQHFIVEIKSVNHRYSDFYIKLPRQYSYLEEKIKAELKKHISRGKVDVYLSCNCSGSTGRAVDVDYGLADALVSALKNLKAKHGISGEITLENITSFPEIFIIKEDEQNPDIVWSAVNTALQQALSTLTEMRAREGAALAEDLACKIQHISKVVNEIERYSDQMISGYREQLHRRVETLLNGIKVDPERLETEVVVFADKCSVDEEVVRIQSHLEQFANNLKANEPVGRKLDFLLQEINREVNTIGSKSNNINVTAGVVEVKTELEKIREQVQNIE